MRRLAQALLLVALTVTACGTATERVSGVVVKVDQASLTDVPSFTLRTEAGEMLVFRVSELSLANGGFPANHLREHMATVSTVVVEYTTHDGKRVASRLTDAP